MRKRRYRETGEKRGGGGRRGRGLKYLPRVWLVELAGILNEVYKGEGIIKDWGVARVFPIHKSGEEEDVKKYRGYH